MTHYRLYFHDRRGGFLRAEDINVDSDEAALSKAHELDHAHCIEVWSGARKVGIVKPGKTT